jgi:nucleotide-binding universal stress UspA family protein
LLDCSEQPVSRDRLGIRRLFDRPHDGDTAMGCIRKILVPTDFSRYAWEAFRQAHSLAKATGAGVVVLHVARPPAVVVDGGRLSTDPTGTEPKDIWADFRKFEAEEPGVAVEHEVIVADRADATHISRLVEMTGCDLIVMGTHGLSGLKHRLFGGLTEDVLRVDRCPVMVVKANDAETSTHGSAARAKAPGVETRRLDATSK